MNKWIIIGLMLILILAFSLRVLLPWDTVFTKDGIRFLEVDTYSHMRAIDWLTHNNTLSVNTIDPYISYPDIGGINATLLDKIIDFIFFVFGGKVSSDTIAAFTPPVLAMLTTLVVFFLASTLTNNGIGLLSAGIYAIIPGESMQRSLLGFTDHHILEVLLVTMSFLFLILAIKNISKIRLYIIYFILFCTSLYLYYLTWQGAYIYFAIIMGCIVGFTIYGFVKKQDRLSLPFLSILIIFILFTLLNLPYVMDKLSSLYGYTSSLFAYAKSLLHGSFALASEEDRLTLQAIWGNFGLCFFIAIAGLIITLCKVKDNPKLLILFLWSLATIALAFVFQRFLYYLAINIAILTAIAAAELWNYINQISTDQMRKVSMIALLSIIIVLPLIPAINNVGKPQPSTMNNQWQETLVWLKDNTAEPFYNADYYYTDYSKNLKQPSYTILTWWDY